MSKLKILIVGANKKQSLERVYLKHLNELGVEAAIFDARSYLDNYNASLINKIKVKAGFTGVYKSIGTRLIESIEQNKPNVVLVFKGMEINSETLVEIKSRNIFLVNYNTDHPFIFSGSGSGNKNVLKNGKFYDLHLTYGRVIAESIEKKLGVACEILPFGFELSEALFSKIKDEHEINRVCFVGHPDKERALKINYLVKHNIPVTVFGKNWSNHLVKKPNLEVNDDPLYGENYWRELRRYRVQLNLFRKHNILTHNMRSFEVPAVGGIMLATNLSDHELFFKRGHSYFEYTSDQDMLSQCKMLLSMKIDSVKEIRSNARKISAENQYSYRDRAALLTNLIEKNLSFTD